MHISLSTDTKERLRSYAKGRKRTMTAMIEYALNQMFEAEEIERGREEALKRVLDRKFSVPKGFTARNFLTWLFFLADRYSDADAKQFWGPLYRSTFSKTHKRVLKEVEEEWRIELGEIKKD